MNIRCWIFGHRTGFSKWVRAGLELAYLLKNGEELELPLRCSRCGETVRER